jgi:hypothetical protein
MRYFKTEVQFAQSCWLNYRVVKSAEHCVHVTMCCKNLLTEHVLQMYTRKNVTEQNVNRDIQTQGQYKLGVAGAGAQ